MHMNNRYEFDDREKAHKFAEAERASRMPHEDKYIVGPMFMDVDEIFKHMMWASTGRKYWLVTVESYI